MAPLSVQNPVVDYRPSHTTAAAHARDYSTEGINDNFVL
jgi:hypothetical protein